MARILYFSRDYTPHDHRFLTALAKTDHRVFYLRLEASGQVLENRPLPSEIEQVEWAGGKRPITLKDGFRLLEDIKRVIHLVKPDLVHAGPVQRSAFLVALAGFHPLVSASWGYDMIQDAHINTFWRWATRYTLHRSDALVADCNTVRNLAISFGMPDERIVTFPWGIDLDHFSVGKLEHSIVSMLEDVNIGRIGSSDIQTCKRVNVQTFNLLSTRGWEPMYGVDVIARAFVIAAKKRPELRLVLLGNGSQEALIRQVLLAGGVYARVLFPGQVSYEDLPDYYHQADVYLSASHIDGTSISLLEALATGTPAIVSSIPGNQEWITHGENGWLFPDGDAEALASAILNAMDQRQNLPEMRRKARLVAEDRADWEKNFPQLEKAYALALG